MFQGTVTSGFENWKCDHCINMNTFRYRLLFGPVAVCNINQQFTHLMEDGIESRIKHPILQYSKSENNKKNEQQNLNQVPSIVLKKSG